MWACRGGAGCPANSLQPVSSPILPFHRLHCHAERPPLRGPGALSAPRLYFVHYGQRSGAESNPAGRRAVWPDNVRVVKGDDEEVSADVREASRRRSWSVHSNPRPTGPHRAARPRTMTASPPCRCTGRWVTYLHHLSLSFSLSLSLSPFLSPPSLSLPLSPLHSLSLPSSPSLSLSIYLSLSVSLF